MPGLEFAVTRKLELARLTHYAVAARYPGTNTDRKTSLAAIRAARTLRQELRAFLRPEGSANQGRKRGKNLFRRD